MDVTVFGVNRVSSLLKNTAEHGNDADDLRAVAPVPFRHVLGVRCGKRSGFLSLGGLGDGILYSRPMKDCNSCGKCCEKWGNDGLSASAEEIDWWETYRPDVARYVQDGKIWIDPSTNMYFARCPWLRKSTDGKKFSCDIYDVRPEDCRHYPANVDEMIRDDCEMLEQRDFSNLGRAQRKLDELMIDSRPPAGRRQ